MTPSTDQNLKVRENRLRRMTSRQGLRLVKTRRRDPLAVDYGTYWLASAAENVAVVHHGPLGLDLDAIERVLTTEQALRAR